MANFSQFGNDLYTGRRSIDFIGRQRRWYAFSGILIVLALVGIFARGLNFGIEFRGGSEFRLTGVSDTSNYEEKAKAAIAEAGINGNVLSSVIGGTSVRVQTEAAGEHNEAAKAALATAFKVEQSTVSASLIGPSWGASVSQKAIQALITFLLLVALVMAVYFRTWKMAVAGLVALIHDLVITVGIYALFGFEITPSSMIGFLTILGYSLYDTVVVFDKVRENTAEAIGSRRVSYVQAANLAVNQTLVRSINTTVVALLPILAILIVGFTKLGPGTLLDLSLALFVGIAVGAYSSIFIATPLLVDLRRNEPALQELAKHAAKVQSKEEALVTPAGSEIAADAGAGLRAAISDAPTDGPVDAPSDDIDAVGRPVHKWAATGPRNQPKRPPRSRR
jgi:preprotein translocase subunit SecF